MRISPQFLLGMAAFGVLVGLVSAGEPAPELAKSQTTLPVVTAPAETAPTAAIPWPPSTNMTHWESLNDFSTAQRTGFIGGGGLYLIQPYFENNPAYLVVRRTTGASGALTEEHVDINHHMEVAPLVWLGYVGEGGFGVRARWWYFREGTNQTLAFPTPADSPGFRAFTAVPLGLNLFTNVGQVAALNVTSKLDLQVGDLEALQDSRAGNWDFLFSAGVRLAHIDQSYNAYTAPAPGGQTLGPLFSGHSFHGAGPVLAVEARRPLGESALALYGSARGALLFGSAAQNAIIVGQSDVGSDHRDRSLPIGELELGLEFARPVGSAKVFGQVALVGQDWIGAGSASRSALQRTPGGQPLGGVTVDSDFAFFGTSIRLGLNY